MSGGSVGDDLVNDLMCSSKNVKIVQATKNKSDMDNGTYIPLAPARVPACGR